MTYLDQLRNSRDKAPVAFHEFGLSTKKFSDYLFCFFEGKDNPYYVPRIRRFTECFYAISCGGREKVLKVYDLIINKDEYDKYKKGFFIDTDFNEILGVKNPPIFETEVYSIENFYVSENVFKRILSNELHLSEVRDELDFNNCVHFFLQQQSKFHEGILTFNAWYACLIDLRNSAGVQNRVQLQEKPPKWLFSEGIEFISYGLDELRRRYPEAPVVSLNELEDKIEFLKLKNLSQVLRGKYELYFLLKCLSLLVEDSRTSKGIVKNNKLKPSWDASSMNNAQALNTFEGYADTSDKLLDYLKNLIKN